MIILLIFSLLFLKSLSYVSLSKHLLNTVNEISTGVDKIPSYEIYKQQLDHFNNDSQLFDQRFLVNDQYYNGSHIMILYIGGEVPLPQSILNHQIQVEFAQASGALLVALEHRYYGESVPFNYVLSVENLKYLSSAQALDDLRVFAKYIIEERCSALDIRRIVCVGGSYPGALSAWFRSLYPHVVEAALSSSAPIFAKEDFYEYDEATRAGLRDDKCASAIQSAVAEIDADLDSGGEARYLEILDELNCTGIADQNDFRYVLADAVAFAVQFNREGGTDAEQTRKDLCAIMDSDPEGENPYEKLLFHFFVEFLGNMSTACTDFSWTREKLSRVNGTSTEGDRQWYWQSCKEFGYFQTAPANDSLRSPHIDIAYHHGLCAFLFGEENSVPDVAGTNMRYGGSTPRGSNIAFTNGELDPWKMLGIYNLQPVNGSAASGAPQSPTQGRLGVSPVNDSDRHVERQNWNVYVIANGSHCNDFVTEGNISDSARAVQALLVDSYLSWLGYLRPANGLVDYDDPIAEKTTKEKAKEFFSPFTIAAISVFGCGVIVAIVTVVTYCYLAPQKARRNVKKVRGGGGGGKKKDIDENIQRAPLIEERKE